MRALATVRSGTSGLSTAGPAGDHFDWQVGSTSGVRLVSLQPVEREACLSRIRERLAAAEVTQYTFRGEVVQAAAVKPQSVIRTIFPTSWPE